MTSHSDEYSHSVKRFKLLFKENYLYGLQYLIAAITISDEIWGRDLTLLSLCTSAIHETLCVSFWIVNVLNFHFILSIFHQRNLVTERNNPVLFALGKIIITSEFFTLSKFANKKYISQEECWVSRSCSRLLIIWSYYTKHKSSTLV